MTAVVVLACTLGGLAVAAVVWLFVAAVVTTDRCDPDVLDEWWGDDATTVELPAYVTGWPVGFRNSGLAVRRHERPLYWRIYLNGRPKPTPRCKRRWALHGRYTAVVALYAGRHRKGSAKGTSAQRHPVCARMQRSVQACWNAAPKVIWRFPSWEYPTAEFDLSLLGLLEPEGALV